MGAIGMRNMSIISMSTINTHNQSTNDPDPPPYSRQKEPPNQQRQHSERYGGTREHHLSCPVIGRRHPGHHGRDRAEQQNGQPQAPSEPLRPCCCGLAAFGIVSCVCRLFHAAESLYTANKQSWRVMREFLV